MSTTPMAARRRLNWKRSTSFLKESRDNIRDQLVDVIMENGEWEPKDALEEYPYQPTATAQSDPN